MQLRIGQAAEHFGVSKATVRRWCNCGRVQHQRLLSGQRVIVIDDHPPANRNRRVALYSRVSSSKQRDDLRRQQAYLRSNYQQYANQSQQEEFVEFHDIGSGLNFKRAGLLSLLGRVQEEGIRCIVVAAKDRLARFGFELIEWLCKQHDCCIMVLDRKDRTPSEELGQDLLAIVQVYCCRWNGQRRYKRTKNDQGIQAQATADAAAEGNAEALGGSSTLHIQQDQQRDAQSNQSTRDELDGTAQQVRDEQDTSSQRQGTTPQFLLHEQAVAAGHAKSYSAHGSQGRRRSAQGLLQ